jgi:hypothetical protein
MLNNLREWKELIFWGYISKKLKQLTKRLIKGFLLSSHK